jgi:spore germination protein KA
MTESTLELLEQSGDFTKEVLDNGSFQIGIMYFTSLCDLNVLKKEIAHPFLHSSTTADFRRVLSSALSCSPLDRDSDLGSTLLGGHVVIDFENQLYKLKAEKAGNNQPTEAVAETTLQGPQLAFSEDAETNMQILRTRYPFPSLIAEEYRLGKVTQTKAYVVYDKTKVNEKILAVFKRKLDAIEADFVQAAGQVEALMTDRKYRWLPIMIITERPDRAVLNLSQGKIVLILNGTPFTLSAPAVFHDFITAMDDLYQPFVVTRTLIILRYLGLLVTVTLPALYIAIVSYNPEMIRVQFALSVAGSRAAVPYASFIEVILMLFLIEALVEASLRLPRYIGATATTVGGLILGQAAQQAGLASSMMIIVTSAVAITNFLIPINAMSFAIRVAKYPLILLSALFGVVGLVAGLFALTLYTARLESFGMPFFRFFVGEPAVSGYKEGDPY